MRFDSIFRRASAAVLLCALLAGPAVAATAASAPAKRPMTHAAAAPASVRHTLPFIADDYARALAEAKARKVPIFVESWAPW